LCGVRGQTGGSGETPGALASEHYRERLVMDSLSLYVLI
jgi:hypothetical protein